MRIVGGDAQQAPIHSWLPEPLTIQVVDRTERPVANVDVEFAFAVQTSGFAIDPGTLSTDENGRAAVRAHPGDDPGTHLIDARLVSIGASGARVRFEVVALALSTGGGSTTGPPASGGGGSTSGGSAGSGEAARKHRKCP